MIVTNKLEKNTILCALKVQLKRLSTDVKECNSGNGGVGDIPFILAANEEIARIKSLIAELEESLYGS